MYKKGLLSILLATIMIIVVACGGGGSGNNDKGGSTNTSKQTDKGTKTGGTNSSTPQHVIFWHAMGGGNTKVVEQLAANFNASQDKINVEAIYQGSYDELLSKLKASMGTNEGPTVVQMYEIGSRFMIDSETIVPMQNFIDADQYDLSQLEPNITGYYTFNNQLYSMPFNTSNPILYYNKDLFKEAGLDPDNPPTTFEEFQEAAEVITKAGQAAGANFAIYGWFMEQLFANQGAVYLNNENGRAALATESLVNGEAGVRTLTWWKDMVDSGVMLNLGRKTDDSKKAFSAGQVAMILDSTAALKGLVENAEGRFEIGTGFLPKPSDAKDGGVIVGGASLWMLDNRPQEEQDAAWEFIKFVSSPKEQAYWSISTGYFPVTIKAYEEQILKDNLIEFPQFQTAIDQLHQTELNTATQGGVMGVFPEARQIVEGAIEEALNNRKSPKDALDAAANEISAKMQQYNKTVGQ